jgi:DNA-directed RNA polymerase specialized sigma24 family protein
MNAEARAEVLASRRDQLVAEAARMPGASRLAHHDCELAVDQAITYVVMDCRETLPSRRDVERVFWAALKFRISDAARGRTGTIRNGWKRADETALEHTASHGESPADALERAEEWAVVREFAQTLKPREQRVLRVKYFSGTPEPLGYKRIAERLRISFAEARAADRTIHRRLERFAAIYTAGQLCPDREHDITALAEGAASREQAKLAKAHVAHCSHCNSLYAEQVRAFRSAAFERKVASILPAVDATDRHRLRVAWDAITDTLSRPFAHDASNTALQLSSTGVGRGLGAALSAKVLGACLASVTALSVCVTVALQPSGHHDPAPRARATPTRAKPTPTPKPSRIRERPATQARARATPIPTATPRPTPQPTRRQQTQGGTGPTDHEQTPASPAPANAASDGSSEFDPLYQPSQPAQPAPVPAAPGSSEFF